MPRARKRAAISRAPSTLAPTTTMLNAEVMELGQHEDQDAEHGKRHPDEEDARAEALPVHDAPPNVRDLRRVLGQGARAGRPGPSPARASG